MNTVRLLRWFPATAISLLAGCATSTGAIVNPGAPKATYHSAYLVVHGDRSSDMDTNIQRELMQRGLNVSVGADGGEAPGTDLVVKYTDEWKWDLAMYLRRFDLMLFDGKSKVLLASGSWKNSAMHGFHSAEKVTDKVLEETFDKLGDGK